MARRITRIGVDFELTGIGWLAAAIQVDDEPAVRLTASYLSDALGDLLGAVSIWLSGADAVCSWAEEPGETLWSLTRRPGSEIGRVVIDGIGFSSFDHAASDDPRNGSRLEIEGRVPVIAQAIADGAGRLRARAGAQSYEETWVAHPFPSAALGDVRRRL